MVYSFGNKEKLLVKVNISHVNVEEQTVIGGFELWINNNRFGDITINDFLSGNYWEMVLKLKKENIPILDISIKDDFKEIYDIINNNYFGEPNDVEKGSLSEILENSLFWGKFVLSPNGEIEFDQQNIFYYLFKKKSVKLIYNNIITDIIEDIDISIDYLDKIATAFDNLFGTLLQK